MTTPNEELRARPLGQQPRESECTAEAARYFHDEGWNAAIAALARQEAVACETCGGTGWVEFEGYGNGHHRKCPHCKHPAPPSAGEAEWPLFTWSGIAPRKLDALRSQGWSVNGYALYRDGMRGLIDLHGAVHWVGESPTPPIAALAPAQEPAGGGEVVLVDRGALTLALNVLRRAGKDEVADALSEGVATPAPHSGGDMDDSTRDEMFGYVDACADVLRHKGKPIMARELSAIARRLATPTPQTSAFKVPSLPGNWPEDAAHENGDYECTCCHCGATFYGHKRRVTCRVCVSQASQQGVSDAVVERAKRASDRLKEWRKSMPAVWYGNAALDEAAKVLDEVTAAGAAPEGCGVALIAAERQRQIAAEGWTPEHDDAYQYHELARAAACYATANWGWDQASQVFRADVWPWDEKWWKPDPKNQLRNLARAGALIAAEIDRLQRATPQPGAQHGQEGR